MDLELAGRCALVTGGTSGLGKALVTALAQEGVNVCFSYRREPAAALAQARDVEQQCGVRVLPLAAELASAADRERLFRLAAERLGPPDILINNAGVWPAGLVKDISLAEWQAVHNVNLTAAFHLSQLFINHHQGRSAPGNILNISSQAAFHGSTTGHAHYAASKAGLIAFARSLAREVAARQIVVNNIALGIMDTPMVQAQLAANAAYYLSRIPLGRVAQPEEIAAICVFMVSAKTRYMTGTTLDVTGGMLMR